MLWKKDYYSQQGNFPFLNYLTTSHNKFNWAKYKLSRKDWVEQGKFLKWFSNSGREREGNLIPVLLDNEVGQSRGLNGDNYWDLSYLFYILLYYHNDNLISFDVQYCWCLKLLTQLTNDDPYILLNSVSTISGEDEYHNSGHSSFAKWEHFSGTAWSLWSGSVWSGFRIQIEYRADGQISNKNLHSLRWIFLSQKELCNFSKVLVTS